MAYDRRSVRGYANRTRPQTTKVVVVGGLALVAAIIALTVFFAVTGAHDGEQKPTSPKQYQRHDSLAPSYDSDGKCVRWYVFVDPETDIEYLWADNGACHVRLDRYGRPKGAISEIEYEYD